MNVVEFIRKEFCGWSKYERVVFPAGIVVIILLSLYMKDSKIALISAICGITYTILAGKGKISCYLFGLCGTLCYAFLSYKNNLFGNLCLYLFYYFPMQIFGIFKWKQHLKDDSQEIVKTKLSTKERVVYFLLSLVLSFILYLVLKYVNDQSPMIDAVTSVFSIVGLLLTVKRCIEQWHIWFVVNGLSTIMWINAYLHGSNCFATVLMWATYFVLSIYFLQTWKKEIKF